MNRINRIINNELYLSYIEKIKFHEKERIFCGHDVTHFLDVCRLGEIDWLGLCLNGTETEGKEHDFFHKAPESYRELIYAAGLLHDIGRWQEYEEGISHETASGNLAPQILEESGFSQQETDMIVKAIVNHRNPLIKEEKSLSGILYRADKKSRPCFLCEVRKECNWSDTKKNLEIR